MKKKFSVAGLVFLAICTIAATIQWYSDQPSITRLEDSMVLAVERATPKGYRSITLASLRDYALNNVSITNYTIYSTNFWISNSYVSNYVVTNVYNDTYASNFFLTQNYITNQYSTNVTITNWYAPDNYVSNFFNTNIYVNDTYVSNYFTTNIYSTTVTNVYETLNVSNIYSTNIYTTNLYSTSNFTTNLYTSNAFITNLYTSNAYITNLTVNNLYALTSRVSSLTISNGISFLEHIWGGPTNQFTLSTNEYYYVAYTPCAVTNLAVWQGAGYAESALLAITNASSSNITFTVHSPIRIPYGETSRSYTVTNGDVFFGSFRKGAHGQVFVPRGFLQP